MRVLQDEDVEALTSLGLTVLQAKVYLTLVKLGIATIKEISKTSGVARQDLYRITSELQEVGLVEKVIAAPTKFKAIELTEGVAILLQRVHKKELESRKKILKLIQRYKYQSATVQTQKKGAHFILVPEKEVLLRVRKLIENTQTSVDVVTTLNRFQSGLIDFNEAHKKASKRGVKFRIITNKPEDENSLTEMVKTVAKNFAFEIRYINTSPLAAIAIYDKKEMIIATSTTANINEVPILMSNNSSLIAIAQSYFDVMWVTAVESQSEETFTKIMKNCEQI